MGHAKVDNLIHCSTMYMAANIIDPPSASSIVGVQENDDNGASPAAQIVQTLAAGTYYAKIRASDNLATGTYTIRVFK